MKYYGIPLGLLLVSLLGANAQVSVEVTQEQDQFLPGEALAVAVRITNRSGQTLRLGADADWLTFTIENRNGRVVPKTGDVPVAGEFTLESSKVATKRLNLAPYFMLSEPGHYSVVATLHLKEWGRELSSPPKEFDLIQGGRLWEQEIGVPQAGANSNAPPELRRYVLQQANYLKKQLRLYLRVTDSYGKDVCVRPVGPLVSFSRPTPQVDRFSNLHVLYQAGPRYFTYSVFNPDGELLTRKTYEFGASRPRLRVDDEGKIMVVGGLRHFRATDVPTPTPEELEEDAPPNPASSNELGKARP